MKIELRRDERIIKQGKANFQRGLETVGGRLYLTTIRIVFEPHLFNIQSAPEEIDLASVVSVEKGWTKFLGFVPLFPNAIIITTSDRRYVLTVFDRDGWITSIGKRSDKKSR